MREIPLTRGMVALVDDEDYATVSAFPWHAGQNRNAWYAHTNVCVPVTGERIEISMHVMLMGRSPYGESIDHIDGDGLNNQRMNLRWATRSQQRANSSLDRNSRSGFKGVYFERRIGRWRSRIKVNDKMHYMGSFTDPEEAARAYDRKAREFFGEFARPNFPT